jgi:hypothetical protein
MNNNYNIKKLFKSNFLFAIFVEQCQIEFKHIAKMNKENDKQFFNIINQNGKFILFEENVVEQKALKFYKNKYN